MRFSQTIATMGFPALVGFLVLAWGMVSIQAVRAESFQPIKEAEMPPGFPAPTPVGHIELKHYPGYRKATASGGSEFWTLFRHIKKNGVAMTAPVEMEYGDPCATSARSRAMSFLYQRPDQGAVGKQGNVEVTDVPAMTVVSIGCRGSQTAKAIDTARLALMEFLNSQADRYEVAGPLRVMAHNSPFVPRDKNYFEVQIPFRPVAPTAEK